MSGRLLELHGVSVHFGGLRALNNVSFSVDAGEVVGLIGPNGAGKTTAFNAICGFVPPTTGHVAFPEIGARNLRPSDLAHRGIARTMQGVGLFPGLTVLENIVSGGQNRPATGVFDALIDSPRARAVEAGAMKDARSYLERFDITEYADAVPSEIPYGVSKKVSVARALMSSPRLLLLDEPASGLDESELDEFAGIIRSLRETMGILLVEHNMDFVMSLVDRLVVLNFGEVIATGTPDEVRSNQAVIEAYLGVEQ